jgi:hypothetical protein
MEHTSLSPGRRLQQVVTARLSRLTAKVWLPHERICVPKPEFSGLSETRDFFVKREYSPAAEGAASFHTTRWTIIRRSASS